MTGDNPLSCIQARRLREEVKEKAEKITELELQLLQSSRNKSLIVSAKNAATAKKREAEALMRSSKVRAMDGSHRITMATYTHAGFFFGCDVWCRTPWLRRTCCHVHQGTLVLAVQDPALVILLPAYLRSGVRLSESRPV